MTTSVKWESHLSSPFVIRQGVRQGGVLSMSHYKRYNNPLLIQIEVKYTRTITGSFRIPHITVADDLALLSKEENEMQYILDDSGDFSNQDHYIIHPKKSGILTYLKKFGKTSENDFNQQGKPIKSVESTVHLGIHRDISNKVNTDEIINSARKAAYSLMGAGLHAGNGLKQTVCAYMWSTYVIPKLTYGLEIQRLTKTDLENLEKFQRKCLRQIQGRVRSNTGKQPKYRKATEIPESTYKYRKAPQYRGIWGKGDVGITFICSFKNVSE